MEGLDEREKQRFGMQTDIYCIWETGVHFSLRIICNTAGDQTAAHLSELKASTFLTTEHVDLKFHIHRIIS